MTHPTTHLSQNFHNEIYERVLTNPGEKLLVAFLTQPVSCSSSEICSCTVRPRCRDTAAVKKSDAVRKNQETSSSNFTQEKEFY